MNWLESQIADCFAIVDKVLGEKRSAKKGSPAESSCDADVLLSRKLADYELPEPAALFPRK